jgi:hypothetical protein
MYKFSRARDYFHFAQLHTLTPDVMITVDQDRSLSNPTRYHITDETKPNKIKFLKNQNRNRYFYAYEPLFFRFHDLSFTHIFFASCNCMRFFFIFSIVCRWNNKLLNLEKV